MIESDSFAETPENVSMVAKIFSKIQNEEPEAAPCTEFLKTFKI